MASPRLRGNTAELVKPFVQELEENNCDVTYITLSDKDIRPCKGCYTCQDIEGRYGCVQDDDVPTIMETIIESDCVVLATPIYTWYCTAPMKALLDRHYGLNKFYGDASGSLWKGKKIAIIATHGYDVSYAAEPFETGVKRLCEHSELEYLGLYSVRHVEGKRDFKTETAIKGSRDFASDLIAAIGEINHNNKERNA